MYAVLNMGYTPQQFSDLPPKEKAFVIGCIDIKLEVEKRQRREMESETRR